jgi:hypothetical protein
MELDIILHALYDMSMEPYRPGPDVVEAAVECMAPLGIIVNRVIYEECPLYQYILTYTPLRPVDVYAMAAHHGIHSLAVRASTYLLNLDLKAVSDELTVRMGPQYFMKLVRLHSTRFEALKAELLIEPLAHSPAQVDNCSFAQLQKAKQVWALFCAEPVWHFSPSRSFIAPF